MHPAYFDVRFRTPRPVPEWPDVFVILTGWATTGERWTPAENDRADRRLERALKAVPTADPDSEPWLQRITGYAPDTGHAEPGWAAAVPFDEACDLGRDFRQDALYVVRSDTLYVSYCDARRALIPVGSFRSRLDAPARD